MVDYVQIMATGLCMLALLYYHLRRQTGRPGRIQRLFMAEVFALGAIIVLDMAITLLSGVTTPFARAALAPATAAYYLLGPAPFTLWVLYLDAIAHKDKKPPRALAALLCVPAAVNVAFTCLSLAGNFTFAIDAANVYHRGKYFLLAYLCCYSYIAIFLIRALSIRRLLLRAEARGLFLSSLLPILAGVVQGVFYGVNLAWPVMCLSMLILYLNMQSVQVGTDYLTGLANRRNYDMYLDALFYGERRKKPLGGIIVDIDAFKAVNDVYGHDVGDRVLEAVGEVLRRSVRREDFAARIGGDEFAVLLEVREIGNVQAAVRRIEENMALFNAGGRFPCPVSVSIGWGYTDFTAPLTPAAFMHDIDQRMYENKRAHKAVQKTDAQGA